MNERMRESISFFFVPMANNREKNIINERWSKKTNYWSISIYRFVADDDNVL